MTMRQAPGFKTALTVFVALVPLSGSANAPDIVQAARGQIGVTTNYDPSYRALRYPGGDVPTDRGVCTDVVIRALRTARAIDLQRDVHLDMRAHRSAYSNRWAGLAGKTDRNIDHRRVPNLATYFTRRGFALPISSDSANYLPGDLVTWDLGRGVPHIGVVSNKKTRGGTPLVIHNIARGTREEDILFEFRVTGHFRLPATERASTSVRGSTPRD
jgi:uncharacterized protein